MTSQTLQKNTFLSGANMAFVAELYARYLDNPAAVDSSWASFFKDLSDDQAATLKDLKGPSWAPRGQQVIGVKDPAAAAPASDKAAAKGGVSAEAMRAQAMDTLRAIGLIQAYRKRGHLYATLDPLGLEKRTYHPELDPKTYGFTDQDMDRLIFIGGAFNSFETATLSQLLQALQQTYASNIGVEYMYMDSPDQKAWIQERFETARGSSIFNAEEKRALLGYLSAAEGLEKFLQLKFATAKRFGLEGGEAVIPAIEQALETAVQLGLREVVFGMAHRGRLNVLTNILEKPFRKLFAEFQGVPSFPEDTPGAGDVKYHMGMSTDREIAGHTVHMSLVANPSHLEAVNPVVMGKVRVKQQQRSGAADVISDDARAQVAGLLIHGDAAFAGQGLVAETLMMSELKGYRTGGTLHFIINNQIGFTTNPDCSRSGPYSSDIAKMIQAPIFHVNGDDPEAVAFVARLAAEFRQTFFRDVVVDVVCYRRHGHNETDEPAFTQPKMYDAIHQHPTTRNLYAQKLIAEGIVTAEQDQAITQAFHKKMDEEFAAAAGYKPNKADWLDGRWAGLEMATAKSDRLGKTGVSVDALQAVGKALVRTPSDFQVNSKIARQLKIKEQMFQTGKDIDWATGEALAFGTMLMEGTRVRLSGQDVGRGTFSHRHLIVYDQATGAPYVSVNHIQEKQAHIEAYDSPLSEAAVLGFEYGYTLAEPRALVLWEAQFGDFVNGAQVVIDQFISAAESKWLRCSGLVMLLPHGYEGQGPEHSSARPERFLQLCAEDNMQVANCSTPASYFHILRRQMHRNFRKPLVIMTPKSLLRHKLAVSSLEDFGPKSTFMPVIGDQALGRNVRRVVLCTGKVYYDLLAAREEKGVKDVALVRVEELYPFPAEALSKELSKYPNAEVVWCQEEPENMGYWFYMDRRIEGVMSNLKLKAKRPGYIGRTAAASPATGYAKKHDKEQAELVAAALG